MKEIQKLETWRRDLALVQTFEEISIHESAAAAAAEFARRERLSLDKQNEIGRFRIEVEAKKGEWLQKNYPNGGDRRTNFRVNKLNSEPMPATKYESTQARTIAHKVTAEPERIERVMAAIEQSGDVITPGKVAAVIKKEDKIEVRQAEIQSIKQQIENETAMPPDGLFDVVVIDPPWAYGREYNPETSRVANPYPEMSITEIAQINLPLKPDAVVFLWTTHAFLKNAFNLLDVWGLQYKATLVWDKELMGMGATIRMQCEFCLIATQGKPIVQGAAERDIIRESRRQHSRKPEAFYSFVERFTVGRKLDYFSREQRLNWVSYGAETEKFMGR